MEHKLSNLYDKFKEFINDLGIFNDINKIYNNEHKSNAITSMLIAINKRNNFEKLPNILFSGKPQFNNIAGFEAVYNKAGQLHSPCKPPQNPDTFETIYSKLGIKTMENWHYDMLYFIYHIFHKNTTEFDFIITTMNEEWHNYNVNGPNDEFITLKQENKYKQPKKYKTTYPIKFLGDIVKPITHKDSECDIEQMKFIIKHRIFYIGEGLLLVNIHSASNMEGQQIADEIIKLLKKIKNSNHYKKYEIILGGDSNVYYGSEGVKDITYLAQELSKMKYKLLISKHIVAKYRPYNYFQNAQSATKGGDWMNQETMIITYPETMDIKFDKKHYIQIYKSNIKLTDFYKTYRYGFLGAKNKNINRKEHMNKINSKNWYNNLYSDHIPIYCDLLKNEKKIRLIFTNNLSINSNRGINNNTELFKIKDIKKLEKLTKNEINNFFIEEIGLILENPKIEEKNKLSYLKKLLKTEIPNSTKLIVNTKKNDTKKNDTKKNDTKKNKIKKNNTKKNNNIKSSFTKIWNQRDNCINYKLI